MMNNSIKSKKNLLLGFCALFSILFSSCSTMNVVGKMITEDNGKTLHAVTRSIESIAKASEQITPENEYYIGRSVAAAITSKYKIYEDAPETTKYLNQICNTLAGNSEIPYLYKGYHVAILDNDEINAMATPGGHIFISRGLINNTDSEDALASVIAHEISHIQLKHSISAIKTSRVTSAVAKTTKASAFLAVDFYNADKNQKDSAWKSSYKLLKSGADELFTSQEEILSRLINSGFSKQQEFEADALALELMANAGYDPSAMVDMLTLISSNKKKGGWNKTHPKPKARLAKVKVQLAVVRARGEGKEVRQNRFKKMTSDSGRDL